MFIYSIMYQLCIYVFMYTCIQPLTSVYFFYTLSYELEMGGSPRPTQVSSFIEFRIHLGTQTRKQTTTIPFVRYNAHIGLRTCRVMQNNRGAS